MPSRIAVLSDELVNKIAAGEVVERPASVVKELCENSIDAGARTVRVCLRGGGLESIVVVDDGLGMSSEDARLALTRHATSKLRDLADLSEIRSMGFRGEALPAIAGVSRFRMVTAEGGAPAGTQVTTEGGQDPKVEEVGAGPGTSIWVEDLFFNTPARRKFMKRPETELRHCQEAVIRLALANPGVGFFVESDGRSLFVTPPGDRALRERVALAAGPEVMPNLVEFEERRLDARVWGFAAVEPSFSNARAIYTFVNGRYVRDRGLTAAIGRSFREVMPQGRQPAVVLFVELDPHAVDVNVHPQKLEVRFADGAAVFDATHAALSRLARAGIAASPSAGPGPIGETHYALAVERFLARARRPGDPVFAPEASEAAVEGFSGRAPAFGEALPTLNESPPPGYFESLRFLAALRGRFWVCEGRGGTLVVVDPHAAIERVRLSALTRALDPSSLAAGQTTLFFATVELPRPAARRISERASGLARLGLLVEPFGGSAFAVRSLPQGVSGHDVEALLLGVAEALAEGDEAAALASAARVIACHGAEAAVQSFGQGEVDAVLRGLDQADFRLAAKHARLVLSETPFLVLEERARGA